MDGSVAHFTPDEPPDARRPRWLIFDDTWYAARYGIAEPRTFYRDAGCPHLAHSPNRLFDEQWYCARYPDVRADLAAGQYASGFEHYCARGYRDKSPHCLFDEGFYRRANPALFRAGGVIETRGYANGYDHYLTEGGHQGRQPSPVFDETVWRLFRRPGPGPDEGRTPIEHALAEGETSGFTRTSWYFDPDWYLARYEGVREAIAAGQWSSPLAHYLGNWTPMRFDPHACFSEAYYAAAHPDVAHAVRGGGFRNGYHHFLEHGAAEGRKPTADLDLAIPADSRAREEIESGLYPDLFAWHIAARLDGHRPESLDRMPTEAQAKRLFAAHAKIASAISVRHAIDFSVPAGRRPAVTVVMVLHNQFGFTMAALASLRAQGIDIDLILVDSGSTDETVRIGRHVQGARILRLAGNLGFIAGCNAGLAQARAEAVLYLNSDAVLAPNALTVALARLASRPDAGAVGGRIVRLHGRLQEAGCMLWRDGSTAGYLRDRAPDAPEANFVREVDFCSAVFLLVRTDLAQALDGFDPAFAPAYYEDTDFCVRLRKRGHVVLYDPDILLQHYEYGSSDSAWAVGHMERARDIFVRRHREFLRFQPTHRATDHVHVRSSRRGQRRVLFIEDRIPRRRLGSGFVRSNDIIQALVELDWAVSVFPLHPEAAPPASPREDFADEVEVLHDRTVASLAGFLAERSGFFDLMWIGRTHNLRLLRPLLDTAVRDIPPFGIILDTEAVVAPRVLARRELGGEPVADDDLQQELERELDCARFVQRIVAVNERDAAYVRQAGHAAVGVLGHLAPPRPTPRGFAERRGLLFVGALHAEDAPNFDSLVWFVHDVLPIIAKALGADVELCVAGHVAGGVDPERFAGPGVRLLGEVADLTPLYDGHRVFVAPTRYAAGIPFKVHEAASFGLPVVATSLLCSQLGWTDGQEILDGGARDAARFAAQVVRLHEDPAVWQSVRAASLARLAAEHQPELFRQHLSRILQDTLAGA